jgi:hypothetical protein
LGFDKWVHIELGAKVEISPSEGRLKIG